MYGFLLSRSGPGNRETFFILILNCTDLYDSSVAISRLVVLFVRGLLRSLWVGVCVAIPSGAGVALSILSGNAGSLVGVAISASLLPPAVNAVSVTLSYMYRLERRVAVTFPY